MREIKRMHKCFFVWQEQEEEKWLRAMAAQGWHLRKVAFCTYDFEQGKSEDIVYRLYSHPKGESDLQACIALFEDMGWEWVDRLLSWQYFRKAHEEGKLDEILSDNESKWEALKRWRNIAAMLGALNLFNFVNITFLSEGLSRAVSAPMILIRLLILAVVILLGTGTVRIQQRMNQLKDEQL